MRPSRQQRRKAEREAKAKPVASPESAFRTALSPQSGPLWHYALVACVALGIQAVQIAFLWNDPAVQGPIIDGRDYHQEAVRIVAGAPAPHAPHFQSPLLPWALSVTYRILGTRPENNLFLQAVLVASIALLVLAIGRRFLSPRAALAAGLAATCYGPLLFFASQIIPSSIETATVLLVVLLSLAVRGSDGTLAHVGLGLACGLAVAARGTVAPVVVWLALRPWRHLSPAIAASRTAALFAGVFLGVLPVAVSNALRSGEFLFATTNLGNNLWLGNNPDIVEATGWRPGWQWDYFLSEPARHGALTPIESSDWHRNDAIAWALSNPLDWIRGVGIKLSDVFNGTEIPRNMDPYGDLGRTPLTSVLLWNHGIRFPFGLVLPLAATGLAVHWRGPDDRSRVVRTIALFVLLNVIGLVLFFSCGRYRLGYTVAILPLAVSGGVALAGMIRRRIPPAWPAILVGAVVALASNLLPPFTGPDLRDEGPLQEAMAYDSAGRIDEAERRLEELALRKPDDADVWRFLGQERAARGDPEGAIAALRKAVVLAPDFAHAWHHLGSLLLAEGKAPEAVPCLEKAVAVNPAHPLAWGDLAAARVFTGDFRTAEDAAHQSIRVNPDNPKGWMVLGFLRIRAGVPASAEEPLKRSIVLNPSDPQPRYLLALSRANQGHESEAKDMLGAMLEQWPDHRDAQRLLRHLKGLPPD